MLTFDTAEMMELLNLTARLILLTTDSTRSFCGKDRANLVYKRRRLPSSACRTRVL